MGLQRHWWPVGVFNPRVLVILIYMICQEWVGVYIACVGVGGTLVECATYEMHGHVDASVGPLAFPNDHSCWHDIRDMCTFSRLAWGLLVKL